MGNRGQGVLRGGGGWVEGKGKAYLKAAAKSALPHAGAPKEMERTSAVGHCTAAQAAARVDTHPAAQKPRHTIRLGFTSPKLVHAVMFNL